MSSYQLPVLRIWVNPAIEGLRVLYKTHIEKHNKSVLEDPHPNSGFDLFVPTHINFLNHLHTNKAQLVNHEIKAAMYDSKWRDTSPQTSDSSLGCISSCAYYLYPRSSIYKTPLILANSVGIIDSGYRGWVCSAFRYLPSPLDPERREHATDNLYQIEENTRLTQICHPNLVPFLVELVDDESVLEATTRGEGGFGSTGR